MREFKWFLQDSWPMWAGLVALIALMAFASRKGCSNDGEMMGVRSEWRVFGGCYLERADQMLPRDRWFALEHIGG